MVTVPPLEQADDSIKLAVDLIYLLECNDIAIETALAALAIVRCDLLKKQGQQAQVGLA